jgi:plasmid stability protein
MTITLKNIPPGLHARLRDSAARNRRSLNSEILARLEADIARPARDPETYAAGLRAFTDALPKVDAKLVTRFKNAGRP